MIKVGDIVAPFDNINYKGKVKEVQYEKVKTLIVGGSLSRQMFVTVIHSDGKEIKYRSKDLMNLQDR